MGTIIQWRRGTAAQWTSANPTLLAGETGLETDTGKMKIGNGTTAWVSLAYYAAGAVLDSAYTAADEVMVGTGAGTHAQVTLAASQFLAKKATGTATNVTAAEARTILGVPTTTEAILDTLLTEQGDVIYASAASTPAALAHGTSGQVLTSGGHAANPSWTSPTVGGIWTLLETLSPTAVASISSSTLTAYSLIMIMFRIAGTDANRYFQTQLNGDTGLNYAFRFLDTATAILSSTGQGALNIAQFQTNAEQTCGILYLPATLGAVKIPISACVAIPDVNQDALLTGAYTAGANITSYTFKASVGTITGKIQIYGVNFP